MCRRHSAGGTHSFCSFVASVSFVTASPWNRELEERGRNKRNERNKTPPQRFRLFHYFRLFHRLSSSYFTARPIAVSKNEGLPLARASKTRPRGAADNLLA